MEMAITPENTPERKITGILRTRVDILKKIKILSKKSHGHKSNKKSLCGKLLLHTKMNYTQGFCLIFNCFRVSFF